MALRKLFREPGPPRQSFHEVEVERRQQHQQQQQLQQSELLLLQHQHQHQQQQQAKQMMSLNLPFVPAIDPYMPFPGRQHFTTAAIRSTYQAALPQQRDGYVQAALHQVQLPAMVGVRHSQEREGVTHTTAGAGITTLVADYPGLTFKPPSNFEHGDQTAAALSSSQAFNTRNAISSGWKKSIFRAGGEGGRGGGAGKKLGQIQEQETRDAAFRLPQHEPDTLFDFDSAGKKAIYRAGEVYGGDKNEGSDGKTRMQRVVGVLFKRKKAGLAGQSLSADEKEPVFSRIAQHVSANRLAPPVLGDTRRSLDSALYATNETPEVDESNLIDPAHLVMPTFPVPPQRRNEESSWSEVPSHQANFHNATRQGVPRETRRLGDKMAFHEKEEDERGAKQVRSILRRDQTAAEMTTPRPLHNLAQQVSPPHHHHHYHQRSASASAVPAVETEMERQVHTSSKQWQDVHQKAVRKYHDWIVEVPTGTRELRHSDGQSISTDRLTSDQSTPTFPLEMDNTEARKVVVPSLAFPAAEGLHQTKGKSFAEKMYSADGGEEEEEEEERGKISSQQQTRGRNFGRRKSLPKLPAVAGEYGTRRERDEGKVLPDAHQQHEADRCRFEWGSLGQPSHLILPAVARSNENAREEKLKTEEPNSKGKGKGKGKLAAQEASFLESDTLPSIGGTTWAEEDNDTDKINPDEKERRIHAWRATTGSTPTKKLYAPSASGTEPSTLYRGAAVRSIATRDARRASRGDKISMQEGGKVKKLAPTFEETTSQQEETEAKEDDDGALEKDGEEVSEKISTQRGGKALDKDRSRDMATATTDRGGAEGGRHEQSKRQGTTHIRQMSPEESKRLFKLLECPNRPGGEERRKDVATEQQEASTSLHDNNGSKQRRSEGVMNEGQKGVLVVIEQLLLDLHLDDKRSNVHERIEKLLSQSSEEAELDKQEKSDRDLLLLLGLRGKQQSALKSKEDTALKEEEASKVPANGQRSPHSFIAQTQDYSERHANEEKAYPTPTQSPSTTDLAQLQSSLLDLYKRLLNTNDSTATVEKRLRLLEDIVFATK